MTPHLATAETPFFLVYGRDPNLPLHQLPEPMQQFLGDPYSGCLNLKSHHLALAIAKKIVLNMQKRHNTASHLILKLVTDYTLKTKQPGKWDLKWRAGYRIVCIECNGHYLHIENQATGKTRPCNVKDVVHQPPDELWNVDTTFG